MASEAGKGDAPRKQQDQTAYEAGWENIFGSKKKDKEIEYNPIIPNSKGIDHETLSNKL